MKNGTLIKTNIIITILITILLITILFSCMDAPHYFLTLLSTKRADLSTDIVITADESIPVFDTNDLSKLQTRVIFSHNEINDSDVFTIYYNHSSHISNFGIFKSKLSDSSAKYTIPFKTASGGVFIIGGPDEHGDDYEGYVNVGATLYINYPQTLSFSDNTVDIGQEVTITSSQPFFDKATFSQTKLDTLLSKDYYIVWVEGDIISSYNANMINGNPEKRPVTREYYVDVTTDSITIKVPPYAKKGKVHIINEAGFASVYSLLVTDPNAPAYFSSSVDLVVNN